MNKIKIISFLSCITLGAGILFAQHLLHVPRETIIRNSNDQVMVRDEYLKLMKHYMELDSTSQISGDIKIYDSRKPQILKEDDYFTYHKKGNQFIMQFSFLQVFCNGREYVQLDTLNKLLTVGKTSPVRFNNSNMIPGIIEKYFNDTSQFKISGSLNEKKESRTILLTTELSPEIKSFSVTYDTLNYTPLNAEIHWWKKSTTHNDVQDGEYWISKIEYKFKVSPAPEVEKQIKKIVTIRDKEVIPIEKYKNYSLQNGL